jgi:uncharacterized protein (DUF1697 family)
MVYVALLRGINVGGKNKVDMKMLRQACTEAGMKSVVTYINTGNIIFTDVKRNKSQLVQLLEATILKTFDLTIKVLIRNFDEMKQVIHALPNTWTNDQQMKSDVLFLSEEYDSEEILQQLPIKSGIDTVHYVSGAILWSVERKNITKSGMHKLIGTKLYRNVTIRNVNTTRKIVSLMQEQYR